jgi:hypothetical protein
MFPKLHRPVVEPLGIRGRVASPKHRGWGKLEPNVDRVQVLAAAKFLVSMNSFLSEEPL